MDAHAEQLNPSVPPQAMAELQERVKELTCLYAVAAVFAERRGAMSAQLARVVEVLPGACRFPERAVAHLRMDDIDVASRSGDLDATAPRMSVPLRVAGAVRGEVVLAYLDAPSSRDASSNGGDLFLAEERALLATVASQIGVFVAGVESEQRRADMEVFLRHADRLATIGQLAAGVAHELNEPLGNALGFAQLALKAEDVPPQVRADLGRIAEAALHGREIIRKLLVFARQAPASMQPTRLNSVVEEAMFLLEAGCENPGVRFVRELAAELPDIEADPVQIRQVVTNLVINAMQAIPSAGVVTIRTEAEQDTVILSVHDTGTGMPPDVLRRAFDPFFTTKEVGQGTGLGLAVVQGIVAGHGGTIEAESQPSRGSTFCVRLPTRSRRLEQGPTFHG